GLSTLAPDLEAKQLELLRAALPELTRVGVLTNANSPSTDETTLLEATTRALHLALTESRINRSEQLAPAFAAMKQAGMGAGLFRYHLWFIDPQPVATTFGDEETGRHGCGALPLRSVVHRSETSGHAGSSTPSAHDAQFAAIRGGGGAGVIRRRLRLSSPPGGDLCG